MSARRQTFILEAWGSDGCIGAGLWPSDLAPSDALPAMVHAYFTLDEVDHLVIRRLDQEPTSCKP